MLKAFKYRLYPTKNQAGLLNKHIGSSRFIYNLALEAKQMAWLGSRVKLSCFDLIKQLPDLKKDCEWLKEVNSQSLQQSIRNLDDAFTRFFSGKGNFPRFKRKSSGGSFNIPQSIALKGGKIVIPKFKEGIDLVLHRPLKGVIKQATISMTPAGKYFISILCETMEENQPKVKIKQNTAVGVDLGVKAFLTTSNGEFVDNPKYLRQSLPKLKYLQRKFSKYRGKRTKHRLTQLYGKVSNQRRDFLHKTSTELIKNHDSICLENLDVIGMLTNRSLALSVADAGWATFVTMLKYKAEWYGKNILQIGRFEPSSKTCSYCGDVNQELTLQDREWICGSCDSLLDRDINAAVNIKGFALKNHLSVERRLENRNELPSVGVLTSEALGVVHTRL